MRNLIKRILFSCFFFALVLPAEAQFSQEFFMSQYGQNLFLQNPGYAGVKDGRNIHFFTRSDIPTVLGGTLYNYALFSYDQPLDTGRSGFGVTAFYEREFSQYTGGLDAVFSYRVAGNENFSLRLGVGIGGRLKSILLDPLTNPSLLQGSDSRIYPVVHTGLWLKTRWAEAGIAGYNLNKPDVKFLTQNVTDFRTVLLFARYLAYEDERLQVYPSVMVRFPESKRVPVVDLNLYSTFSQVLDFGAGIRFGGIPQAYMIGQVGARFGKSRVGLSYERALKTLGIISLSYLEGTFAVNL